MRLILMPTVAVASMKQCAKTYEVQRTPTPVRVTKVLPGPTLGRWRDPARARAGLLPVRAGKFSFSAIQNTKARSQGPMCRPLAAGRPRCPYI